MLNDSVFLPYTIISSGSNAVSLKAGNNVKIIRMVFRMAPLFILIVGLVLYFTLGNILLLYTMGGIAILEFLIFSFIKLPGDVQMDNVGFTLQTVSVTKLKQKDYLWSDIDFIKQKTAATRGGIILNYSAVFKNGKSVRFLSFPNYYSKQQTLPELNTWLKTISNKEVASK